MAEFFLTEDRSEKAGCYAAFRRCFLSSRSPDDLKRLEVPYEDRSLPALRFRAPQEKAIVVVHGGYDSFTEEFYLTVKQFPQ